MFKLLILILIANILNANINHNGFFANINNFNFKDNQNYSLNSEYLQSISSISCGDSSNSTTTILQNVDLKSGKFTCLKYVDGQYEPQKIDFSIDLAKLESEKNSLKKFIDNDLGTNVVFYNQLGTYVFPGVEIKGRTNYISNLNISELINDNNSLSSISAANKELLIDIDSHTNANQTLSNILTGIFMLNPDYFQNDIVSENGNLRVLDYALDNGTTASINDKPGVIDSVIRIFAKEKNENINLKVTSLTDFLDKKFWGYYVYFLINIERAFNYIIISLMLFGVTFIAAKHAYSKFKSKIFKKENTTDANGGSIVLNGILAISFFLIPVQTSQIVVPDKFLYENQNNRNSTIDNEFYQQSTLAKATLRFFADMGSTWANTVSDYSLYAYLRFLETKQGFITEKQVTQNQDAIKKLFEEIFYLKKDYDFLNYICKPAYASYLSTNQRFNTISKEASESLFSPINLSSSAIGKALKIDRIDPVVCQKLEKDVFTNSRKILSDYAYLRQQNKINKAILENSSNNNQNQKVGFATFVDLVKFQQNNFGWINSVSVPVTYNLFFQNSSPVFNEDIQLEKIKESNDYNIISAWSKNEEQKTEIKNSIDNSIIATIFGQIQSKFVWFTLPGFNNIYENVHQFFSNVAGLDPTAQQIKEKESNLDGAISSAKYFVSSAAAGPLGMLSSTIMSVVSTFTSFISKTVTSALQYAILMYISLIVSIFIMTMMVTSLFLIIVASAMIIKIVIYYLEVIILAVTVDLLLFYALVTNKKEYFENFIGKSLVILILTPLTIVFAAYLYTFISTAAVELYLLLVGMIFDTISVANATIIENSDNSFFNGLNAMVTAITFKALGIVVVHFLSMLLGVYLIFKLKDMILNMIGINSEDSNLSKMTESIQGRITGDTVRI